MRQYEVIDTKFGMVEVEYNHRGLEKPYYRIELTEHSKVNEGTIKTKPSNKHIYYPYCGDAGLPYSFRDMTKKDLELFLYSNGCHTL